MNIVILGASGLIGHKLFEKLPAQFDKVYAVMHRTREELKQFDLFRDNPNVIYNVDVLEFKKLTGILTALQADVVLNCVGITKRKEEINIPSLAIETNSLYPHKLADWAKENNARVIHFSTDCVFDGSIGDYDEDSPTTGKDAYGLTKAMGEIRYDHCLTIRSSFIGQELLGKSELLEWFLNQKSPTIKGFTKAFYSGVSTIYMCKVVADIIKNYPDISDLHTLARPTPISKYDLLCLAKEAYGSDVEIIPDDSFEIMPTLNGSKLAKKMNLEVPSWKEMMHELASENKNY